MRIVFFGSTSDSVIVLEKLFSFGIWHLPAIAALRRWQAGLAFSIVAAVTQPPRPVGRTQILTPTPVEMWTKAHHIPVLSFPSSPSRPSLFSDEQTVIDTLQPLKADLFISASFGQRIPIQAIQAAQFGGLNVHPSLLPRWRGADPVPWAILSGDHQTGVTIVTLSENFDAGTIIAQKKIPITDRDFSDPLRTKLFGIGADLLAETLPKYVQSSITRRVKTRLHPSSYARRLTRDDGFEPWEMIQKAFEDPEEAQRIDRKFRALTPWPGIWTLLRQGYGGQATKEKRLKILACHLSPVPCHLILDTVQLEGKKPVPFAQFKNAYLR